MPDEKSKYTGGRRKGSKRGCFAEKIQRAREYLGGDLSKDEFGRRVFELAKELNVLPSTVVRYAYTADLSVPTGLHFVDRDIPKINRRIALGMTNLQIARATGFCKEYIRRYRRGIRPDNGIYLVARQQQSITDKADEVPIGNQNEENFYPLAIRQTVFQSFD